MQERICFPKLHTQTFECLYEPDVFNHATGKIYLQQHICVQSVWKEWNKGGDGVQRAVRSCEKTRVKTILFLYNVWLQVYKWVGNQCFGSKLCHFQFSYWQLFCVCVCVGVGWGGGWQGICCNHTRTCLNSAVILFIYALHLFVMD